jgi:hypothetical protein
MFRIALAQRGPATRRAFARLAEEQIEGEQFAAQFAQAWSIPVFGWILAKPLPRKRFVGSLELRKILWLAFRLAELANHRAACRRGERRDLRRNAIARKVFSGEIQGSARAWQGQTAERCDSVLWRSALRRRKTSSRMRCATSFLLSLGSARSRPSRENRVTILVS